MDMDIIGERGEALFRVAITQWCGGEPWFRVAFLGDKAEGLDFMVVPLETTVFEAMCFVQVKSTAKKVRYSGTGKARRLLVTLTKQDAMKLGTMKMPAYVVGIDVIEDKVYIRHVPYGTKKGFKSISVRSPLNCATIRRLWNEVNDFWEDQSSGLGTSDF